MHKDILAAAIGRDEAEAFAFVEPLNRTCTHVFYSCPKMKCGNFKGERLASGREAATDEPTISLEEPAPVLYTSVRVTSMYFARRLNGKVGSETTFIDALP